MTPRRPRTARRAAERAAAKAAPALQATMFEGESTSQARGWLVQHVRAATRVELERGVKLARDAAGNIVVGLANRFARRETRTQARAMVRRMAARARLARAKAAAA